jgi:hypothetical protein
MRSYVPHAAIIIVEQSYDKPFNRAKLLNIGFLETAATHYCFHDIDMLPVKVDYTETSGVTQMAYSNIQRVNYLGGVTMFDHRTFIESGGYHNEYFHRAEDNEMMFNLSVPVTNRFGIFRQLPHARTGSEFIPELWAKAQLPRSVNMLETCKYAVAEREEKDGYVHLKVIL